MSENILVGLAALGIPLLAAAYLMLRRHAPVFRMVVAMILLGLGYLTATGAISDIGATLMGQPIVPAVIETPVPAAPAETAPTPAPTPSPTVTPEAAPSPSDPAATVPGEPPPAPEDAAPAGAPIDSPAEAPASGEETQPTEPAPAPVTP
ncbi:MAG: hypothetical protein K2X41_02975 [Hyphomicrobium sp.]|nr:hypothetical protein [Hyphomicrobium sp.]